MKKMMICAVISLAVSFPAFGSYLVFDRGLPTDNLNNAAAGDRSNVAWAFGGGEYMVGDDFTISTTCTIDTIRVWVTGSTDGLSLYLGADGDPLTVASTNYTSTLVTYLDCQSYQGTSGSSIDIYQLDFDVDIDATGGTKFNFVLKAPNIGDDLTYLHASNADLSGSTQDGADDLSGYAGMLEAPGPYLYSWDSLGNGWDKSSDINVQVYAVPLPATILLGFLGLGIGGWKLRKSL